MLGGDGMRYLTATDPLEISAAQAIAERAAKLHRDDRKQLAVEIVNTLAKAMQ